MISVTLSHLNISSNLGRPTILGPLVGQAVKVGQGVLAVKITPGTLMPPLTVASKLGTIGVIAPATLALAEFLVSGLLYDNDPHLSLRYSDNAGATWSNAVTQSMGKLGEYLTSIQFRRLGGNARDRVIELEWTTDSPTSLNAVFLEYIVQGT